MLKKVLPLMFLGFGVFILLQVALPVIAFRIWEVTSYNQNSLLTDPLPDSTPKMFTGQVLGISINNVSDFPAFVVDSNTVTEAPYESFKLSIPKIGLSEVMVKVNSNDFERNLAHLPGSALPGQKGNVFVTGHSSLPKVVGKDDKIPFFVNLPKLDKGDEIILDVYGQKFTYKVVGLRIVDPKEVSVINPPDNEGRYISLMTCVPPGLNLKRLIVLGKLI